MAHWLDSVSEIQKPGAECAIRLVRLRKNGLPRTFPPSSQCSIVDTFRGIFVQVGQGHCSRRILCLPQRRCQPGIDNRNRPHPDVVDHYKRPSSMTVSWSHHFWVALALRHRTVLEVPQCYSTTDRSRDIVSQESRLPDFCRTTLPRRLTSGERTLHTLERPRNLGDSIENRSPDMILRAQQAPLSHKILGPETALQVSCLSVHSVADHPKARYTELIKPLP